MENYELIHHGILGMKWGVRRTPEQLGRTRDRIGTASNIVKDLKTINDSVLNIRSNRKSQSDLSSMSDKELKDRVARLNLEQQYSSLSRNKVSKGQQYVGDTLNAAGSALAVASSIIGIAIGIKQLKS